MKMTASVSSEALMLTRASLKEMTSEDLRRNILSTYFTLRVGIVVLSAALPVGLCAYSLSVDHGLVETSMSAFYGAHDGAMRNWFVGVLCAVGAFLILYQGFSPLEDWLLNAAGGCAVLTAMTPCNCWCDALGDHSTWHKVFAFAFFGSMASVVWFCAEDTITLLTPPALQEKFRRTYRGIAFGLAASPIAALVVSYLLQNYVSRTFYIEWFGVWVFAFYWFTKSAEFKITSAEKRALRGELKNVKSYGLAPANSPAGPPPPPQRHGR
jgi:hypothetical protein